MPNEKSKTPDAVRRFRSAYSPRVRVCIFFPALGRTKQAFKRECDINHIMAHFKKTGVVDFVNKNAPRYQDVTGLDYLEAMQTVTHAQSLFNELPSQLRAQFENDPALFLDFVSDPENTPEMARLGLLTPEATAAALAPPKPAATSPAAPETPPPAPPKPAT